MVLIGVLLPGSIVTLQIENTYVYFNGVFSEMRVMSCGVPQGRCLGPLLFSIFTNDLPLILNNASIAMYADDSTIYSAALTPVDLGSK